MSSTEAGARPVTPLGILAETLDRISADLASVDGVADSTRAELNRACALAGGLDPYLSRCTTPESPALHRLAERTQTHDWSRAGSVVHLEQEMLSGHVEGRFLAFLVHLTRARRVLEIGMFTGYSALAMAEALPPDGTLVACEIDPGAAGFAQEGFGQSQSGHQIEVLVGPAAATLARLAAQSQTFDLVFLDADKGGYLDYLNAVLDTGLLAPHGVVCVDNTLLQGETYAGGEPSAAGAAIAAFNRAVAEDPRVEQVMLPLRDGLTLIRRA